MFPTLPDCQWVSDRYALPHCCIIHHSKCRGFFESFHICCSHQIHNCNICGEAASGFQEKKGSELSITPTIFMIIKHRQCICKFNLNSHTIIGFGHVCIIHQVGLRIDRNPWMQFMVLHCNYYKLSQNCN